VSRFFAATLLSICLLGPVAGQTRHEWNDREDPYWHQYLKEHHKKEHDWAHASKKEQRDYWKWRDAHPDAH
jgi:hypothetical protein